MLGYVNQHSFYPHESVGADTASRQVSGKKRLIVIAVSQGDDDCLTVGRVGGGWVGGQ